MALRLPFFQFHVHDWLTSESVILMNNAQRGAYIMLLAQCWANATCTLPMSLEALRSLAQWTGTPEEFAVILKCFQPAPRMSDRLTNPRLWKEWQTAKEKQAVYEERAKQGAEARWHSPDLVKKTKATSAIPTQGNGIATWNAYAEAYYLRYHVQPVRNQTVNSHLKRLVDRLGQEEAPQVAAFYLSHNKPFYVTARHPTNLLLKDAEGLRTEWATGIKATTSEAKNAEFKDNVVSQADRVIANLHARSMKHGQS